MNNIEVGKQWSDGYEIELNWFRLRGFYSYGEACAIKKFLEENLKMILEKAQPYIKYKEGGE